MGASWFIRPESRRLPLSDQQWILVKDRLSTGEFRAHLRRGSFVDSDGVRRIDSLEHGFSLVVAYLLDWSLEESIRGVSEDELIATLNNLDHGRFAEIKRAIETHETAMNRVREQEKNAMDGEKNEPAISPSPSAVAGVSSGSVN